MTVFDSIRSFVLATLDLAKFAMAIAIMVGIPPLAQRLKSSCSTRGKNVLAA